MEEKRRKYLHFNLLSDETWKAIRNDFKKELEHFRQLSRKKRQAHVDHEINALEFLLRSRFGNREVGFHYNMHGGKGYQYVEKGGILATQGDSLVNSAQSMLDIPTYDIVQRHASWTVFYYPLKHTNIADFITSFRPTTSTQQSQGVFAILFDVENIRKSGRASLYQGMSGAAFAFDGGRGTIGVPLRDFLLPPLQVNTDVPRRLGIEHLTRQEIRLATLRHLLTLLRRPELDGPLFH